jgi:hypothetical protein
MGTQAYLHPLLEATHWLQIKATTSGPINSSSSNSRPWRLELLADPIAMDLNSARSSISFFRRTICFFEPMLSTTRTSCWRSGGAGPGVSVSNAKSASGSESTPTSGLLQFLPTNCQSAWGLCDHTLSCVSLCDRHLRFSASSWELLVYRILGCSRTTRGDHQDYSKPSHSTTKYSGACCTDIPGPTKEASLVPTITWAPRTTRLVVHGARRRGLQDNGGPELDQGSLPCTNHVEYSYP